MTQFKIATAVLLCSMVNSKLWASSKEGLEIIHTSTSLSLTSPENLETQASFISGSYQSPLLLTPPHQNEIPVMEKGFTPRRTKILSSNISPHVSVEWPSIKEIWKKFFMEIDIGSSAEENILRELQKLIPPITENIDVNIQNKILLLAQDLQQYEHTSLLAAKIYYIIGGCGNTWGRLCAGSRLDSIGHPDWALEVFQSVARMKPFNPITAFDAIHRIIEIGVSYENRCTEERFRKSKRDRYRYLGGTNYQISAATLGQSLIEGKQRYAMDKLLLAELYMKIGLDGDDSNRICQELSANVTGYWKSKADSMINYLSTRNEVRSEAGNQSDASFTTTESSISNPFLHGGDNLLTEIDDDDDNDH